MAEYESADELTPEQAAAELRHWLATRTTTDRLGRDLGVVLDELAAATERAETAEARVVHLEKARNSAVREWRREHDAADELQSERDEARARLAELGELRTEWGYRYGDHTEEGFSSEAAAMACAARTDTIVRRTVGSWFAAGGWIAADAAQDGRSGPVELSEASGAREDADTAARTPQGPQEATMPDESSTTPGQPGMSEVSAYATGGFIPGPKPGDPPLLADFDRCTFGRHVVPYAVPGDSVLVKLSEGVAYIPSDVPLTDALVAALREMGCTTVKAVDR